MSDVTRGDKVITGDLYIGGEIINAALVATIQAAFPLYDALIYKGVISSLATFPAASKGDLYKCTAAGSIGGTGPVVAIGDIVICNTDDTSAGNYATVGTEWDIIPATNIDSLDDLIAGTAEDDFICAGSTPFAWVKKTLAQVKSILGLGSAAYTASGDYDAAGTAAGLAADKVDKVTFHSLVSDTEIAKIHASGSDDQDLSGYALLASMAPDILALKEKTPVNAVAASAILTLTANADHRDTCTLGTDVYTFQTAIGVGTKATGDLTFVGNAVDNEVVVIGTGANERTYTFADAIAELGVKASGDLTLTGNAVEDEVVVIDTKTYRWRDQIAGIAASKTLTFTAVAANGESVTVDTTVYDFVTALTEAKATSILTLTGNPTDGNSVTIGSTVYTFKETLAAAYDVLIGVAATNTIDNLIAAITAGAGEGSTYGTGTVVHPDVTAVAGAGDTMDITANVVGTAGNSIVTTELSAVCSWTAGTMAGGIDSVLDEILVEAGTEAEIDNLVAAAMTGVGAGTKFSTGQPQLVNVTLTKTDATNMLATAKVVGTAGNSIAIAETCAQVAWAAGATFLSGGYATAIANDVIIGGTAEASIDNLVLAIAAASGSGVNWGVDTVAHTTCDGTKGAADKFTATAKAYGDAGNAYASTDTMGNATWGAATLAGGEDPDVSYIVLIGATAEASIDNLVLAITAGAGEGTNYGTGTVVHPDTTGAKQAADVFRATANAVGDAGNLIVTTTDVGNASWGAGLLAGGDDADTAFDVLIGANASDTIDNLIAAINAAAGEGTTYGTGTTAQGDVTAAAGGGDTMDITAAVKGVAGNAIAKAEDNTNMDWDGVGAVLTGGIDGTVGVLNEMCVDASYIYHAIAANTIADTNWRRVTLGSAY